MIALRFGLFYDAAMPVLNAKLQAPRLPEAVQRSVLRDLMDGIRHKALTTVVAGAGYGKTTLVAQAMAATSIDHVWYRLDAGDMDFAVFMTYLIKGMAVYAPEVEKNFTTLLRQPFHSKSSREAFLHPLLAELEGQIKERLIIVLDDYHLIQDSDAIRHALTFLTGRPLPWLHLVLISRQEPDFPVSRLRVLRQLLEIREPDLVFSVPEIESLYARVFRIPLNNDHLKKLHQITCGWAASLILFHYTLDGQTEADVEARLSGLAGSQTYVFDYLEEHVFGHLPRETREFMLKTALLTDMDAQFCDRLLKTDASERQFQFLARHHLLTFAVDGDGRHYAYHHLLRNFLQTKFLESYSDEALRSLHMDIARLLEADGHPYEAIDHYLAGADIDSAVRLLESAEIQLLLEGKLRFMQACLDKIPHHEWQHRPYLHYLQGRLHSLGGNPMGAIGKFQTALTLYQAENADVQVIKCLADLGFHYYFTGRIREADQQLKALLREDIDTSSPVYIQVMTFLTLFAAILGKLEDADAYAEKALRDFSALPEMERQLGSALVTLSHSYRFYVAGDFTLSQEMNFNILKAIDDYQAELMRPLTYFQIAATAHSLGEYETGCKYAGDGLHIAQANDIHDSQTGWLHYALSMNLLGQGNLKEAYDHARRSLAVFNSQGNRWGMASAYDQLHLVTRRSGGDLHTAESYLGAAANAIRGCDLPVTEGLLNTGLAGIYIEKGDYPKAEELLKQAEKALSFSTYYTFRIELLYTRLYAARKRRQDTFDKLAGVLQIAENKGYGHFLQEAAQWLSPLVAALRSHRSQKVLMPAGPKAGPMVPGLHIHLLGQFRVLKGGEEIPTDCWKNTKAALILKYLAARYREGFIPKDVLLELLWPGESAGKSNKRFNVAFSALRKILEPNIARGAPSAYLLRQQDSYRLNPDRIYRIDSIEFFDQLALAEKAERLDPPSALTHYLTAVDAYRGSFLQEDLYADWCGDVRDHLQTKYLQAVSCIIRHYEDTGDHAAAVQWADRYLIVDKYAEEIYRRLMVLHGKSGNTRHVVRTFEKCRHHMSEGLDCAPSPETVETFNRLTSAA